MAETPKRQPKTKKDHITTISLIELCTKYKDSNDDFTVVRDLSMITWCFSCFLHYDEISSIRCKDIIFKDDHLQIKILKSKTDQYRMGNEIVISKGQSFACPYNLLKKYFLLPDTNSMSEHFLLKPIFRSKHRCSLIYKYKPLSYIRVRECIISRLIEVIFSSNGKCMYITQYCIITTMGT